MTFKGWANRETWSVMHRVTGQGESIYKAMVAECPFCVDSAKMFMMGVFPNGTPDMTGPEDYDRVDWVEIAETWNSYMDDEE